MHGRSYHWKGINGHRLNVAIDAGRDSYAGTDRATVARDVMAYTLGYFSGDYQPVGGASANAFPMTFNNSTAATGKDLFNGNISHTTVALSRFNSGAPNAYTYKYDQLNRLVDMRQHALTISTTTWTHSASMNYAESISYDANGNIKTYLRNGANITNMPLAMDNLTYNYTYANDPVTGVPYLVNNKLTHVSDQAASTEYSNTKNATSDIDNQQSANYTYDKIGNLISDVQEGIEKITWNVYGKIDRIKKAGTDYIQYGYDPSGNRVYKEVSAAGVVTKNWYVRDAQGNALALYSDKKNGQPGMWWNEQTLYGSSRLGVWKPSINLQSASGGSVWNTIGLKQYELTNHLGNVLTAITDKKLPHDNGSGVIDYYQAETVSATDYYAFGMPMPGRNFSSSTYRYGFNGKENDNDVKGNGNQQDYGMRIYDPRLGRFLSTDPLTRNYSFLTPYQYASNRPIDGVDLDGLEWKYYNYAFGWQDSKIPKPAVFNEAIMNKAGYYSAAQVHQMQTEQDLREKKAQEKQDYQSTLAAKNNFNNSKNLLGLIYQGTAQGGVDSYEAYTQGNYAIAVLIGASSFADFAPLLRASGRQYANIARGFAARYSIEQTWRLPGIVRGALLEARHSARYVAEGFEWLSETTSPWFKAFDFYKLDEGLAVSLKTVNADKNFDFKNIYQNIDQLAAIKAVGSSPQFGREFPVKEVRLEILVPQGYEQSRLKDVRRAAENRGVTIEINEY